MVYIILYSVIALLCILLHLSKTHKFPTRRDLNGSCCRIGGDNSFEYVLIGVSAAALILVRSLRYGIGIDYFYTYVPRFTECLLGRTPSWGDWLYSCLMGLSGTLSPDFRLFFLLDSVIFIILLFYSFRALSPNTLLSVLLLCVSYHYLRSFIFQAQYLALAVSMFSIAQSFSFQKKWIAIVGIIVASGFHSSVLIVLPIYLIAIFFANNQVISKKSMMLISIAFPIVIVLIRPLIPVITETVLEDTRYSVYFSSRFAQDGPSWRLILTNLVILIFMLVIYSTSSKAKNNYSRFFLIFQSFAVCMSFLTGVVPLMYRICLYPMIFQVLAIPHFIYCMKSDRCGLYTLVLIVFAFSAVQFLYIAREDGDGVFPYVSTFNKSALEGELRDLESHSLGDYFWAVDALGYSGQGLEDVRQRLDAYRS